VALSAVVKLGGEVLAPPLLGQVAAGIAQARADGGALTVVHGGGPQATALSQRLGLVPNIVGGRRITDGPTLDVMKMVVAGQLNVDLVAALRAAGVPALGLHGAGGAIRARRRPPRVVSGGGPDPVDFGLVGDVEGFDLALLRSLAATHVVALACLGGTDGGEVLNINADVVASRLAAALGCDALLAVTGVGGVRRDRDDPASRLARLTVAQAKAAIADGTVQGGMIPKLEEAFEPLAAGVGAVHIIGAGEIALSLARPGTVGTLLVA